MDKKLVKRIAIIVLAAMVVVYIAYTVINSNFSMVETETTNIQTIAESIYSDGFVVRNETLITNDSDGVVAYEFDNGGKVAVGGTVAKVYKTEQDVQLSKQIDELNDEIERFKKVNMAAFTMASSIDSINSQLNNKVTDIKKSTLNGELLKLEDKRNELLYLINERLIVTGDVVNYNEKISKLKAQKAELEKKSTEPVAVIKSPVAGYFISSTDGYEGSYDYKKADKMTVSRLEEQLNGEPAKIGSNVIGKVISELNWYVACKIKPEQALELKNNEYEDVSLYMPYATSESIPVRITAVNQRTKDSDAALVLECNYMSPELALIRNETVQIDINTYTGLVISKQALHEETVTRTVTADDGTQKKESKTVKGVYVLKGNELRFKQVSVIYQKDDIYVCEQYPDDDTIFTDKSLELYDKVVVKGSDLYDGKIVKS